MGKHGNGKKGGGNEFYFPKCESKASLIGPLFNEGAFWKTAGIRVRLFLRGECLGGSPQKDNWGGQLKTGGRDQKHRHPPPSGSLAPGGGIS